MVFVNNGISELQKIGIRGGTGEYPIKLIFAGSDNTFEGEEESVINEFQRKNITWVASGINSKYTVQLDSTECNGSDIQCCALTGSNILFTIDESYIGSKNDTFNVQIEGEIIMRRPS